MNIGADVWKDSTHVLLVGGEPLHSLKKQNKVFSGTKNRTIHHIPPTVPLLNTQRNKCLLKRSLHINPYLFTFHDNYEKNYSICLAAEKKEIKTLNISQWTLI